MMLNLHSRAMFGLLAAVVPAFGQPYLILHDFFVGPTPTPAFIRDHRAYLDTLPFDGLAVYMRDPALVTNVSASVYNPVLMSYSTIYGVLAPIAGLQSTMLKQNFGLVFAGAGVDVFDDAKWAIRLQNMHALARAFKDVGLKGMFFDNENYLDWAHYPGAGCSSAHTLKACQDQMRLRGSQVMQALVAEFPDIVVLTLHSPVVSDETFFEKHYDTFSNVAHANELIGPFFVGLVEGQGSQATVVDGGEFYSPRTPAEFLDLYNYQKRGIISDAGVPADNLSRAAGPNGFIPAYLRPLWPTRVNVSTGLYDRNTNNATMNPGIMTTTLTNALQQVDRYVWLYVESITFMEPPGRTSHSASTQWVNAVRDGKAAALATKTPDPHPQASVPCVRRRGVCAETSFNSLPAPKRRQACSRQLA